MTVVVGRFWAKVDRRGVDECWPWLASKQRGYGRFKHAGLNHEYNTQNTYVYPSGHRGCRVCHREKSRGWRRRAAA